MANKILKIGNKEIEARSSGLTSTIYRNLFDEDLEQQMAAARAGKLAGTAALEMFKKLAFVMCWQAIPRDVKITEAMKSISLDDFYTWLDDFECFDTLNQDFIRQVTELWVGNSKSLVELKNV